MTQGSHVRKAALPELSSLLTLAAAAQEKLTRAGSEQQIAGYSEQNVHARIERGELWALEVSGGVIGGAFVEPATPERFPHIALWNAVLEGVALWFLYGLIVHPEHQGQGWGRVLLDGIYCKFQPNAPSVLLLDCWAGNTKLRRFYTDAGFDLHGVFPEGSYEIAVFRRNFSGCSDCSKSNTH